jgi:hypothetical protein
MVPARRSAPAALRGRFWVEAALASMSGLLFVLTLAWPDWLEAFGIDPDHSNGSAEWAIVAVLLAVAAVSSLVARVEWVRAVEASV